MSDPSDNHRDPPADVAAELERLGEAEANDEEIRTARRFAEQLEGGLHLVEDAGAEAGSPGGEDELADLARALRTGAGEGSRAGEAVTGRILEDLFEAPNHETEAPADDLEQRRAGVLGGEVDRLVAGFTPSAGLRGEVADLTEMATAIRASGHAQSLSPARLETLVSEAVGEPVAAATPRRRYRGSRVLGVVSIAAVLVAGIVGLVLMMGAPDRSTRQVPEHLTSRSTRDILPNAFPRSQSASERIDLIYHDRLRAYRELRHGAPARGRSARGRRPQPTPAVLWRLGGGR